MTYERAAWVVLSVGVGVGVAWLLQQVVVYEWLFPRFFAMAAVLA